MLNIKPWRGILLLSLVLLLLPLGCQSSTGAQPGKEGGPCLAGGQCDSGLVCSGDVCLPDGKHDGGPAEDGGPIEDGGPAEDGGPIEDGGEPDAGCTAVPLGGHHPWDTRYLGLENLQDNALRQALLNLVKNHNSTSYSNARSIIYNQLDKVNGRVQCVYTGQWVTASGSAPDGMNIEHTWPQSKGAGELPAKSDLNHLFPTMEDPNNRRSNYNFGEVLTATWSSGGSELGADRNNRTVFEPRSEHKGDVARAIFYFSVRYEKEIPDFEEIVLKFWNCNDPPSDKEKKRNNDIEGIQGARNPFIDHPEYVERIQDF